MAGCAAVGRGSRTLGRWVGTAGQGFRSPGPGSRGARRRRRVAAEGDLPLHVGSSPAGPRRTREPCSARRVVYLRGAVRRVLLRSLCAGEDASSAGLTIRRTVDRTTSEPGAHRSSALVDGVRAADGDRYPARWEHADGYRLRFAGDGLGCDEKVRAALREPLRRGMPLDVPPPPRPLVAALGCVRGSVPPDAAAAPADGPSGQEEGPALGRSGTFLATGSFRTPATR